MLPFALDWERPFVPLCFSFQISAFTLKKSIIGGQAQILMCLKYIALEIHSSFDSH
jgi:hypothetical protein